MWKTIQIPLFGLPGVDSSLTRKKVFTGRVTGAVHPANSAFAYVCTRQHHLRLIHSYSYSFVIVYLLLCRRVSALISVHSTDASTGLPVTWATNTSVVLPPPPSVELGETNLVRGVWSRKMCCGVYTHTSYVLTFDTRHCMWAAVTTKSVDGVIRTWPARQTTASSNLYRNARADHRCCSTADMIGTFTDDSVDGTTGLADVGETIRWGN